MKVLLLAGIGMLGIATALDGRLLWSGIFLVWLAAELLWDEVG